MRSKGKDRVELRSKGKDRIDLRAAIIEDKTEINAVRTKDGI